MKEFPIHQNLSTSFVDLPALVRHLRGFQFVGTVHLELSNYEARIIFDPRGRLSAEEIDHRSGILARGTEAYNRILTRSRDSHGHIHVLRTEFGPDEMARPAVFVERSISLSAREMIKGIGDTSALHLIEPPRPSLIETDPESAKKLKPLLEELLETIENTLAKANLNFAAAFKNASVGIKSKYAFLDPERKAVFFKNGKVEVLINTETGQFVEAMAELLETVLDRLNGKKSFSKLASYLQHRILIHIQKNEEAYVELGVLHCLDRLVKR